MSLARVVAVAPGSPAAEAGVQVGDVVRAVNGQPVRDVIQYRVLVDEPEVVLDLDRGGLERLIEIDKEPGTPLGVEVDSALFDQVRTCDNHCEFCFIYQLPPGLRKSLYVKDDDYRLSFLYGNFTTLTRFTEADLERVVTEGLSPLNVSIHATDPEVRADLLRNRRGAISLRWLRALLDHGVEVHGQVVVCPGLNDADVLDDTLAGVLDEYPELADVAVVPLGISQYNTEPRMRAHTRAEAERVVDVVEAWQETFLALTGRRMVHAADEYYLLSGRPFPPAEAYGEFSMHEDGIGMARAFELEFNGASDGAAIGTQPGFFAWVDGAPAEGYRAPRWEADTRIPVVASPVVMAPTRRSLAVQAAPRPVAVLTGEMGAQVLTPLVASIGRDDTRILTVENRFFGGNIGVSGLMVGEDVARTLAAEPAGHRYLLPDVCLSGGRFLDGMAVDDLPHPVEVLATDGVALRDALAVAA
jgi:putative radical SAM enzyme (TIGR03279 family)